MGSWSWTNPQPEYPEETAPGGRPLHTVTISPNAEEQGTIQWSYQASGDSGGTVAFNEVITKDAGCATQENSYLVAGNFQIREADPEPGPPDGMVRTSAGTQVFVTYDTSTLDDSTIHITEFKMTVGVSGLYADRDAGSGWTLGAWAQADGSIYGSALEVNDFIVATSLGTSNDNPETYQLLGSKIAEVGTITLLYAGDQDLRNSIASPTNEYFAGPTYQVMLASGEFQNGETPGGNNLAAGETCRRYATINPKLVIEYWDEDDPPLPRILVTPPSSWQVI